MADTQATQYYSRYNSIMAYTRYYIVAWTLLGVIVYEPYKG